MKHEIQSHQIKSFKESVFWVQLIPDTKEEADSIKDAENMNSKDDMINNYLTFCLGKRYSVDHADFLGNGKVIIVALDNVTM